MARQKSKMIKVDEEQQQNASIALYRRVSTDKQREEGYSLDAQEERLRAFAKTIDNVVSDKMYTDDGYSGGSLDRPAISQLISDIEDGRITHVIVVKLDRLSRSQKDTLHLIEDIFIPNNVAFISIQESFNTNTPFGRAMVGILSVFAQLERENIYERTRTGMLKRVEAGYWPGGARVPFGYDYDKERGILVPNEDAEKVRYAYAQYIAGKSMTSIAEELNLNHEMNIRNLITRKTNAGYIPYKGKEYKGLHEPIISLETYEEAMRVFQTRSAAYAYQKTEHLLSGMLVCGVCGAKMRYQKWSSNKWKIVCYSRSKSKRHLVKDPNCDNYATDSTVIENGVLDVIFGLLSKLLNSAKKSLDSLDPIDVLEERYNEEKKKLYRLYGFSSSDDDEVLLEMIDETKTKIKKIKERIEEEKKDAQLSKSLIEKLTILSSTQSTWEEMSFLEKRETLFSLINSVIITYGETTVRLKLTP